jgi:hypothetical protein
MWNDRTFLLSNNGVAHHGGICNNTSVQPTWTLTAIDPVCDPLYLKSMFDTGGATVFYRCVQSSGVQSVRARSIEANGVPSSTISWSFQNTTGKNEGIIYIFFSISPPTTYCLPTFVYMSMLAGRFARFLSSW